MYLKNRKCFLLDTFIINIDAFDHVLLFPVEKPSEYWSFISPLYLLFDKVIQEQLELRGILLHMAVLYSPSERTQELMCPNTVELKLLPILQIVEYSLETQDHLFLVDSLNFPLVIGHLLHK